MPFCLMLKMALVLIGATTENPFFEVNKALISRSTVFMLKPLTDENIISIIKQLLKIKSVVMENLKLIYLMMHLNFLLHYQVETQELL